MHKVHITKQNVSDYFILAPSHITTLYLFDTSMCEKKHARSKKIENNIINEFIIR